MKSSGHHRKLDHVAIHPQRDSNGANQSERPKWETQGEGRRKKRQREEGEDVLTGRQTHHNGNKDVRDS